MPSHNNGINRYVSLIVAEEDAPRRDNATGNEIYYYHIRDTKTKCLPIKYYMGNGNLCSKVD